MHLPRPLPRGRLLIAAGVVGLCCYALGPVMLVLSAVLIVIGILTIS